MGSRWVGYIQLSIEGQVSFGTKAWLLDPVPYIYLRRFGNHTDVWTPCPPWEQDTGTSLCWHFPDNSIVKSVLRIKGVKVRSEGRKIHRSRWKSKRPAPAGTAPLDFCRSAVPSPSGRGDTPSNCVLQESVMLFSEIWINRKRLSDCSLTFSWPASPQAIISGHHLLFPWVYKVIFRGILWFSFTLL